jgi:iron(III) transport system substrate-binding protein
MSAPGKPRPRNWPRDLFGKDEIIGQAWIVWGGIIIAILSVIVGFILKPFAKSPTVVAYCAQDQVYAERVFRDFEQQTGIKVRAVFDSEAVKTVGIANRLLAEKNHPQCDVFWGNEEMRTRQLAAAGVFRETNGVATFGYRSRRIVINTNQLPLANAPRSLSDLTNQAWRGKLALAYPQFGTTSTHFHALRQHWGEPAWDAWCRGIAANKPFLVDGNSVVVKLVGAGEAAIGLTDSDDVAVGQKQGFPIVELPMDAETLLIPNTAGVVRGAPHAESARTLFEFLRRESVVQTLVKASALEGTSAKAVSARTLVVDWEHLLRDLEKTTVTLNAIFLR